MRLMRIFFIHAGPQQVSLYYHLMLRSLESLKLIKGGASSFDIQTGSQSKMVQLLFDFQTLQLKDSI